MATGCGKRFWKKTIGMTLVGVIVLGIMCAACTNGNRQDDIIEIKFWAMGREGEILPELLKEFEHGNPDVRILIQQIPWSAAHEKLLTAFVGDTLPDVAQIGNTWISEFAALDALARLNEMVKSSSVIEQQDYFPGIWATNRVGNSLYGVPWYVDTRLLFYRQDILSAAGIGRPPRDWSEWMAAATAVKQHVGKDNFALFMPLNDFEMQVSLALQQGVPLLRRVIDMAIFPILSLWLRLIFISTFSEKGSHQLPVKLKFPMCGMNSHVAILHSF